MGGSTKQTTASATSKMSKLNSKLFKGKMVESMRKSTENLSGLLENNVTTSPTGDDPLAAGLALSKKNLILTYLILCLSWKKGRA